MPIPALPPADAGNMTDQLHGRILATLDDIDNGFKKVMIMYLITFYLGIGLIVLSCLFSILSAGREITLLSGGLGLADVVAFLIFKPAESLQRSRGSLAQLISAFLTWYLDSKNCMQVYKKEMSGNADSIDLYDRVSRRNVLNTIYLMQAIQQMNEPAKTGKKQQETMDSLIRKMQEKTGAP